MSSSWKGLDQFLLCQDGVLVWIKLCAALDDISLKWLNLQYHIYTFKLVGLEARSSDASCKVCFVAPHVGTDDSAPAVLIHCRPSVLLFLYAVDPYTFICACMPIVSIAF